MARSVRLIAASDEYDSKPGLIIKGTRQYEGMMAARDGLLIAHDLIEHQNGVANIGRVWDELEALGAIWYCRGQWGNMMVDRPSMYSPEQNIASDVARMFGDFSFDPCYGPGGLKAGARAHDHDDAFMAIVEHARTDIPKEHNDMGRGDEGEDENGWNADLHALCKDYLILSLHRMRIGFRKAYRKYEGKNGGRFKAGNMMQHIKDAVDEAVKYVEYEGQEFVLTYSANDATCREYYQPEGY